MYSQDGDVIEATIATDDSAIDLGRLHTTGPVRCSEAAITGRGGPRP
ncbi:hypothetical protein [Nocardia beijingensis]|nr:hypothetical protein [Nocardia beijingensis]